MGKFLLSITLLILGASVGPPLVLAQTGGRTGNTRPAGERVYATVADSVFFLELSDSAGKEAGNATGFLVSESQILTNAHVADVGRIQLRLGPFRVECAVERIDRVNDLALCGIPAKANAPAIKLADADPNPGAPVFALGNPEGLEKTITEGLFTGYRDFDGQKVAQISAALSPGSSGGPILNSDGELLGVAVSSLVRGQTLNFAVPLGIVRDFLAGKQATVDSAALIKTAKALLSARDELESSDAGWNQLDAQAGEALARAIESSSDLGVLVEVGTIAFIDSHHPEIQVQAARKAIAITRTPTPEMYSKLARALYYATDEGGPSPPLEEAEQAAIEAATLGRFSVAADVVLLGDIQYQADKFQQAYASYLKASTIPETGPGETATAYMNLFRTSHQLGRHAEADNWFKKVGQVTDRPLVREWSEYARFQITLSKYAEAADAYMAASRLVPTSYVHVCQAGTNYYLANRYDEALPAARRCLELAASVKGGDHAVHHAHRIVSDMLSDRGVYDQAAAHAREALATGVDDAYAHHYLARALSGQRRFTEAVTSAKNAIRLSDGKYGFMHFELGNAHFQLHQWPEAIQAFKKAAELEPMDSSAAYNVAAALSNDNYRSDAIPWFREALRRNPNRSDKAEILAKIDANLALAR